MPVEGAFRCGECQTWEHLMAWAAAVVDGPLDADGKLTEYSYIDDCYLHEDSIHCTEHIGARIEEFRDGQWRYWWTCSKCRGTEHVYEPDYYGVMQRRDCPEGRKIQEGDRRWMGEFRPVRIHGEWRPVSSSGDGPGEPSSPASAE